MKAWILVAVAVLAVVGYNLYFDRQKAAKNLEVREERVAQSRERVLALAASFGADKDWEDPHAPTLSAITLKQCPRSE